MVHFGGGAKLGKALLANAIVIFFLLLTTILMFSCAARSVNTSGPVYIRADGAIDPPIAPILTPDNITYTLTGNITADTDGIVIERDNIVIDGAGYALTGSENGNGATLTDRSNVTLRNMTIENFTYGILLDSSSDNTLYGNNISGNEALGIMLFSSPNSVLSGNAIKGSLYNLFIVGGTLSDYLHSIDTSNLVDSKPVYYFINQSDMVVDTDTYPKVGYMGFVNCANVTVQALNLTENGDGLLLAFTNNSKITDNNITNQSGIWLKYSFDITLSDNNITNNWHGVDSSDSSNITLSHNNIAYNGYGVRPFYSSNITLSGNNIAYNGFGVYTDSSSNMTLSNNNVTNNSEYGIWLFWLSNNNTLSGNNVIDNGDGIELGKSSGNTLSGNNVANNSDGIGLGKSSHNTLSGNNVTNNDNGIGLDGSPYNTLSGNNVTNNDNGIILSEFVAPSFGNSVFGNNIAGNRCGMNLSDCSNNSINANTIADNSCGIWLGGGSNNNIAENNITDNVTVGIELISSSTYNRIIGNTIANNGYYGISLQSDIRTLDSTDNTVLHNNFINNTVEVNSVWTSEPPNFWDNGCEGNYWSAYNGTDMDNDGVGDTYLPWKGVDNFPLMNVYWNPCDINHDLEVNRTDIDVSANAFGTHSGDSLWNPHADITGPEQLVSDGKVDMRDIGLIARHFGEHY